MAESGPPIQLDYAPRPAHGRRRRRIALLVLLCLALLPAAWLMHERMRKDDAGFLPAPDDVCATPAAPNQIDLTWSESIYNQFTYDVERSSNGGLTWKRLATVSGSNCGQVRFKRKRISYSDATVAPNTTYQYRIRARQGSDRSPLSDTASAYTLAAPPKAPTNLRITIKPSAGGWAHPTLELAWTDNSTNEDGFEVTESAGDGRSTVHSASADTTSYQLTASSGGLYYFEVAACHGRQKSVPATASFRVLAYPENVKAVNRGDNTIDVTWNAVAGATGYAVDWGQADANGSVRSWTPLLSTNDTRAVHADAPCDARITYRVTAAADPQSRAELSNAVPTTPAPPTGLKSVGCYNHMVRLLWTDNSTTVTGFEIEREIGAAPDVRWQAIGFVHPCRGIGGTHRFDDTGLSLGATGRTEYRYRVRAVYQGLLSRVVPQDACIGVTDSGSRLSPGLPDPDKPLVTVAAVQSHGVSEPLSTLRYKFYIAGDPITRPTYIRYTLCDAENGRLLDRAVHGFTGAEEDPDYRGYFRILLPSRNWAEVTLTPTSKASSSAIRKIWISVLADTRGPAATSSSRPATMPDSRFGPPPP